MSNSISLVGRIGKDAEVKQAGSSTVMEFTMASDTGYGERKTTSWFKCQMWGTRGEKLSQYCTKGTLVFITGELTLRKYTTKDGKDGMSADINLSQLDLISSKRDSEAGEDGENLPF